MTINRWAAKSDPNQKEVMQGLEAAGYTVFVTRRPTDLVCAKDGVTWLLEVKLPGKEKDLTKFQKEFFPKWPGKLFIVTSSEDALNQIHGFSIRAMAQ